MSGGAYYEILGVTKDASAQDIESAYTALLAEAESSLKKGSAQYNNRVAILNSAYETLSDPDRRASYNKRQVHCRIYQSQPEENLFLSALKEVVFSKKMIFVAVVILVVILSVPNKKPSASAGPGNTNAVEQAAE